MTTPDADSILKRAKRALLRGVQRTGACAAGRYLTRRGFYVVGLHGVSIEDEHRRFPTLFISPQSFTRRLEFLLRHYTLTTLDDVVRQQAEGRLASRQAVLTFDDGYFNFFAVAMPLLQRYGVPAAVYLVTREIASGEPIYNLLVRDLVASSTRDVVTGLPHDPEARVRVDTRSSGLLAGDLIRFVSGVPADMKLSVCRAIAERLEVDIDSKLSARLWHRMTPDELRQVADAGFSLQLHTHSHLNVIADHARIAEDVITNRRMVEQYVQRPAEHFCYPLGLWQRAAWESLAQAGIRSATTTKQGPNFVRTPPLALRRYLTGEAMSQEEFEFELSGLRWLAHLAVSPTSLFAPREKRVTYKERAELY